MTHIVHPAGHGLRARLAKARQRGLTLIEAAAVLGIMAAVIVGVMWVLQSADENRRTSQTLTQVQTIVEKVKTLYNGQSTYTGISDAALVASNSLPTSMVSGSTIRHSLNGTITVAAAPAAGGANSGFSVVLTTVPKGPCAKLLAGDQGRGVYSMGASTTKTQPDLPFTPVDAATACSGVYNTVTFVYN